MPDHTCDVLVIGAGVAGLTASTFTARHDLTTITADGGDPLLRRNAHIENFPGFPRGVNSRLLLDMMHDQATNAGATILDTRVTILDTTDDGFTATTTTTDPIHTQYVIAATKNTVDYLSPLDVDIIDEGKLFVATDDRGRTTIPGLYAAGRMARKPHQAIVAAGHGAEVAVTLLEDDDRPFYHDWVAPARYFTGRDRPVPPGCEEITDQERRQREDTALDTMQTYFRNPHPDKPQQHPAVEPEPPEP